MAKTKEISTLDTISANSAYILGKSKDGKIGFINDVFNAEGKLADVPDHSTFASKKDLESLATKAEIADLAPKTDLEQYVPKTELSSLATKGDLNQYVKFQLTNNGDVAYMQNEANGGLIKFTKADGTMSKFTLFDASDENKTMLQIIVKDGTSDKVAKINGTIDGLFYIKTDTNAHTADNELATKGDLKGFISSSVVTSGNTSYAQNEQDGFIMKFIRSDKQYSKVGLWNDDHEGAGLQLVIGEDKGGGSKDTNVIKIEGTKEGMFYAKHTGTCLSTEEIAVKGDLTQFSPAQITGVSDGDIATCHNSQDGGSLKYESATHTAFIGVNCDASTKEMLAEFALTEKKDGTTLKTGNRLLAKTDGIFYTKGTDLTTTEDNEIATIADVKKKLDAESKGHIGSGKFSFVAGVAGASVKYLDETRKKSSTVGVCDGNTDGILAQMVAGPMEMGKGPKIFLDENIAVYCKGKLLVEDEDEILTKKDIKDIEAKVKEIDTLDTLVEAAQDDINQLETKIAALETRVQALETQMAEAVQKVNAYTANVSELLKQSS